MSNRKLKIQMSFRGKKGRKKRTFEKTTAHEVERLTFGNLKFSAAGKEKKGGNGGLQKGEVTGLAKATKKGRKYRRIKICPAARSYWAREVNPPSNGTGKERRSKRVILVIRKQEST